MRAINGMQLRYENNTQQHMSIRQRQEEAEDTAWPTPDSYSMYSVRVTERRKLEAIQRWSVIYRVWPRILTYQKFLLCVSSQGQDLYSYQKLNMYIYWFSSESGYRRRRRRRATTPDTTVHVQPLARHIANKTSAFCGASSPEIGYSLNFTVYAKKHAESHLNLPRWTTNRK